MDRRRSVLFAFKREHETGCKIFIIFYRYIIYDTTWLFDGASEAYSFTLFINTLSRQLLIVT
jgi:hypothetical protein